MKTPERPKAGAGEPRWYASAARPAPPGELTKAEPDDLARAEPEEDAVAQRRTLRWVVPIVVVAATISVAAGNVLDSIFWAAAALFYAIAARPRARVPKLLRYFSIAAVVVLAVVQLVMLILKLKR